MPDASVDRGAAEDLAAGAASRLANARRTCGDLAVSVHGLASAVLGSVSARIVADLASSDAPAPRGSLAAEELARGTEGTRAAVRAEILAARDDLRQILAAAAARGMPVEPGELNVDLLGEPAPALPSGVELRAPSVPRWLRAAPWSWRGSVRAAVQEQLEEPLRQALSSWADALRGWTGALLDRLAAQVAVQADPVRARAALVGPMAERDGSALKADLAALAESPLDDRAARSAQA